MEEEEDSEKGRVHDISDYLYLVDTHHFDEDEKSVYKARRVFAE